MWFIAVDPGEKHCGLAWFDDNPSWHCTSVLTLDPDQCVDRLWRMMDSPYRPDFLLVEEWRIYPGQDDYGTCGTAEVIGALRHKARQVGLAFLTQPARVMKPTAARMRRHKISMLPGTAHTNSAQLHGWHRLLRPAV